MARKKTRPDCMFCSHDPPNPAAKGRRFCSKSCAAAYAEELVNVDDEGWCFNCNEWLSANSNNKDTCGRCNSNLLKPEEN